GSCHSFGARKMTLRGQPLLNSHFQPSRRVKGESMRSPVIVFAIVAIATFAAAQSAQRTIGASALWQPTTDFLPQAHVTCDKVSPPPKFNECIIDQMAKAGAPADAVSFSRELYKESGGEVGYMAGFDKVGTVDIAWVKYPLRSSNGLLLVNGQPRIINAEDLKLL